MRQRRVCTFLSLLLGASTALSGCIRRDISEADPNTTNVFIDQIDSNPIDKIDLLFVVDNSVSMADKQKILEQAVPQMLGRLVRPDCVTLGAGSKVTAREASTAPSTPTELPTCPGDMVLEFNPVNDIHIGVITSSLGGHGSSNCGSAEANDRALLMPKVRDDVPDPHGTGFLVWHPASQDDPAGTPVEDDLARLQENFRKHVVAAGENGCGFEAPLEAWYRFLVDPEPPAGIVLEGNRAVSTGIDQDVLAQRKEFLRPDSLVGIVMLTDENDCSMMEGGDFYTNAKLGWMVGEDTRNLPSGSDSNFPTATAACETNPNDPCCLSCFTSEVPSSCDDKNALSSCEAVGQPRVSPELDRINVRCFDQRRRFGVDLLYPTDRYVDALTAAELNNTQTGAPIHNQLLLGVEGDSPRRSGLVFLAGIAGIPWQDLATDETRGGDVASLSFLSAQELNQKTIETAGSTQKFDRWDLMLGRPGKSALSSSCQRDGGGSCGAEPQAPLDPFLIESIDPRSGTNPLTMDSITGMDAWNAVNGHEQNNQTPLRNNDTVYDTPARDDLQFSCTFPLEPYGGTKDCTGDTSGGCDCANEPYKEPSLCREDITQPVGTTQHWGKAYPPTRILEVLKSFGANSIPASICPKIHDADNTDYGYNPAVNAIIDRLSAKLGGQCLPRQLSLDEEGLVDCMVVEAMRSDDGDLDCSGEGRGAINEKRKGAVLKELQSTGWCSGDACKTTQLCEIQQFTKSDTDSADREACLTSPVGSEQALAPGYCYLEADREIGEPSLIANCPASQRQLLRFVGPGTPAKGATAFVACSGDISGGTETVPAPPVAEE